MESFICRERKDSGRNNNVNNVYDDNEREKKIDTLIIYVIIFMIILYECEQEKRALGEFKWQYGDYSTTTTTNKKEKRNGSAAGLMQCREWL